MRISTLGFMAIFLWGFGATAYSKEVKETFLGGRVKLKYRTDKNGAKSGRYTEYYKSGKIKIKATYKAGQLQGEYLANFPNGKPRIKAKYKNGELHGVYVEKAEDGSVLREATYVEGFLTHPKSMKQITRMLATIYNGGEKVTKNKKSKRHKKKIQNPVVGADDGTSDPRNIAALRRLNAYRYLCDVPWDVTLNAKYCEYAQAGAEICMAIGRIEHHPKNIGMPKAVFEKSYFGTTHSNLHMGGNTVHSIDSYMNDSYPKNIKRVRARRRCINPNMSQTGFGHAGAFSAMYSRDIGRSNTPDFDFIAYPPRGYLPASYFREDYAWSVSLPADKYKKLNKANLKVNIYPLKIARKGKLPNLKKLKTPLTINYLGTNFGGSSLGHCLIFRPDNLSILRGARYWVEITGIKNSAGKAVTIKYLVEFF